MKLSIAQLRPMRGDMPKNLIAHQTLVERAISAGADLIAFPELSLTGYERALGVELATMQDDSRLDELQALSDTGSITICAGLPTTGANGVHISMVIFRPGQPRTTYSKQFLHDHEIPYFVEGHDPLSLPLGDLKVAPAICYESLVTEHLAQAVQQGVDVYLASVADSQKGVEKAYRKYPEMARQHSLWVLMSNCTGPCDGIESAGQSAIWNRKGQLLGRLDSTAVGILMIDTETDEITKLYH